jgi:hypothetical protein
MLTPAEQYRALVNRLEAIVEAAPVPATTPASPDLAGMTIEQLEARIAELDRQIAQLTPASVARHQASSNPYQQDPAQVQQGMAQLKQRSETLLVQLGQHVETAYYQQTMSQITIRVIDDPEDDDMYSYVSRGEIVLDYNQWDDAPDAVLLWSLGHEAGHICMVHRIKGNTPQQLQQQELDADAFATRLCLGMGISRVPAFKWANDKRDRLNKLQAVGLLHQSKLNLENDLANREQQDQRTHPTYQRRFDQAATQGLDLSKLDTDTDQLDRFLSHMSRSA